MAHEDDSDLSLVEQLSRNPATEKDFAEFQRQKTYKETRARREHYQTALVAHGYVLGTSHTKEGMEALIRASREIAAEEKNNGHS